MVGFKSCRRLGSYLYIHIMCRMGIVSKIEMPQLNDFGTNLFNCVTLLPYMLRCCKAGVPYFLILAGFPISKPDLKNIEVARS